MKEFVVGDTVLVRTNDGLEKGEIVETYYPFYCSIEVKGYVHERFYYQILGISQGASREQIEALVSILGLDRPL